MLDGSGVVVVCLGVAVVAAALMILFSRSGDDSFEARYSNRPAPARTYRPPPESYPVAAPLQLPPGVRPVLEMLPIERFSSPHYSREGVLPSGHLVTTGHTGGIGGPSFYVQVAGATYGANSWTHVRLILERQFPGLKVTWPPTRDQIAFEEAKRVGRVGRGKMDPTVPDELKWGW